MATAVERTLDGLDELARVWASEVDVPALALAVAGDPKKVEAFLAKYPQAKAAASLDEILADNAIKLVAAAAVPCDRGPLGCRVMEAGKDYYLTQTLYAKGNALPMDPELQWALLKTRDRATITTEFGSVMEALSGGLRGAITAARRKRERETATSDFVPGPGQVDMNKVRVEIATEAEALLNEAIQRHIAGDK